jgi:hypothetical protein
MFPPSRFDHWARCRAIAPYARLIKWLRRTRRDWTFDLYHMLKPRRVTSFDDAEPASPT